MANPQDATTPQFDDLSAIITPLEPPREGDQSWTEIPFTMTLVGSDTSVARDIWWRAEPGPGTHPAQTDDFYGIMGLVHFEPGETTKEFAVRIQGDTKAEADEDFTVVALYPGTSEPISPPAIGIIVNDDSEFTIAARTSSGREGSVEVRYAQFDATRWGDASSTQIVTWSAAGKLYTPADGADFVGGSLPHGSLTFLPGETLKTIAVPIAPDSVLEPNELFAVKLSDQWGKTAEDWFTIIDDDATVSVQNVAASNQFEGDTGTTNFTFELVVAGDTTIERSVSWKVAEFPEHLGTYSVDAADFPGGLFPTGTVTFAPGETHKLFTVAVSADIASETNEAFLIKLLDPSPGLTVLYGLTWGTIINNDSLPVVAHDDAYVTIQGTALTNFWLQTPSVLGNDIGATAAALDAGPAHGTVELNANGMFTYRPDAGFSGIDSFSYVATGPDGTDAARVTIHVAPIVQDDAIMLNLLALTPEEQVAATYAAFLGRAADAAGFEFWVDQFHAGLPTQGAKALLSNIASSFAISDEAKGLYTFLANPGSPSDGQIASFLDGVYRNLFNRSTDEAGLAYWTGQVRQKLAGGEFVGSVLVDIMSGAQYHPSDSGVVVYGTVTLDGSMTGANDLATLMGKVAVGLEFVRAQQEHGMAWNGAADNAAAFNLLEGVYDDRGSVLVGIKHADDYVAQHG